MKKRTTAAPSRQESAKAPAAVAARKAPRIAARPAALLSEVRELIVQARQTVAQGVNSALVMLYWQIGLRIRTDILKAKRAGYGEQIVHSLSGKLTEEFGRGFAKSNLFNMVRFAEVFPDLEIVSALRTQLSWTHLRRIIYLDDHSNVISTRRCAGSSVGARFHRPCAVTSPAASVGISRYHAHASLAGKRSAGAPKGRPLRHRNASACYTYGRPSACDS